MSPNPFNSGNSFYSGSSDGEPIEPTVMEEPEPERPANPPYARQAMDDSFDPLPQTGDPSFQPGPVEAAAVVGPPSISLPLIAVGLFALWMIFKGEMD